MQPECNYTLAPFDVDWLKNAMHEHERAPEPAKPPAWSFQPKTAFLPFRLSIWRLSVDTEAVRRDMQRLVEWLQARQTQGKS